METDFGLLLNALKNGSRKNMKRALITGISGQDGSYLTELLLTKGYEVHGIVRREALEDSAHRLSNLRNVIDQIILHTGSLENHLSLHRIIGNIKPHECYHLAASSFVSYSFEEESSILNTNFNGTHYLLSSIKELAPDCRFYFAGSSEMFGHANITPQNEQTPFNPRSIYGISKLASYHLVCNYRHRYGLYGCTGILYNHESICRPHQFVTRKITSAVAQIKSGKNIRISLGNIKSVRDWGYAPDYVYAMWLMLNADTPTDYVVATGINHSVQELVKFAFDYIEVDYNDYIELEDSFYRESETIPLCGDSSKIEKELGWKQTKTFREVIVEMIEADLKNGSEN